MAEDHAKRPKKPFRLSMAQTLLSAYILVSIAVGISCIRNDDFFKIFGPVILGLASAHLYGKCMQNSRPFWRFLKILAIVLLVYLAAIITGMLACSLIFGPRSFHG
jgi:hypothetical protein